MRILLVGSSGTIGRYLISKLSEKNEIIGASRNHPENQVDIENENSIRVLLEKNKNVNAIICCAGEAKWRPLDELSSQDFILGFQSKLMGQINLVRYASKLLKAPASILLTSGILAERPVHGSTIASTINGALHSFVKSASKEIHPGIRINVICPGLIQDSYEKYKDFFPGFQPVSMDNLLQGYQKALSGSMTGKVIEVF